MKQNLRAQVLPLNGASVVEAVDGLHDIFSEDAEMKDYADEPHDDPDDPDDTHLKQNDLGIVVAVQAGQDKHGLSLRSFVSFIDRPNMLATYTPSSQSTPLQDPMTARIFCHFINVTGPCMSMYERHPANPSLIFQGSPVLKSQQHIWTCKISRLQREEQLVDKHTQIHSPPLLSRSPGCYMPCLP